MKNKEELKKANEVRELTDEELAQVTGGVSTEIGTLLRGVESEKLAAVDEMVKLVDMPEREIKAIKEKANAAIVSIADAAFK